MQKIIVTHSNPDLDAICSVWLLREFSNQYKQAKVEFVPAGQTYQGQPADKNENIIHVDTGMGRFDHHQRKSKTCAAQLVYNFLKKKKEHLKKDKPLIQLIKVVCEIDHFGECLWPEPAADRYNFFAPEILNGLKQAGKLDDHGLIEFGSKILQGIYTSLKIKQSAKEELKQGYKFQTRWGKAIGILTHNNEVLKLAQKQGFILVVQKDSETEHVRIKARPDSSVDLTSTKEKLKKLDPKATWFLHISKRMLLNGSTKNPKMKPSKLSLKKVIEVLKS